MIKEKYTQEQIDELLKNKNVLRFCGTYFAYTPEFKVNAVKRYHNEHLTPKQIFQQAGFNISIIGKRKPDRLLYDWRRVFKKKGSSAFFSETRGKHIKGGRPKALATLSDAEKIKRLILEVRYLKKENDFLVRLRARKAE